MKKKLIIFIGVIVILFAGLYFVIDYKNNQAVSDNDNPYGDRKLKQSTIDQLNDPLYGDQVMPDELKKELDNKEDVTVYFYSPECVYCQRTTPILMPVTEDLDVEVQKMNLLEFEDQWAVYGIESTPTLIHYKDGKEVGRIVGQHTEEEFKAFFDQYVLE
jgi:thiol-disulfide isomerase/thioredoxin